MPENHEGATSAARGEVPAKIAGHWPTINLIVTEEEDFEHTGSSFTDGAPSESGGDASGATVTAPKPKYVLRIHTDITIDQGTYNTLRHDLSNGNNPAGRQNAYRKIENHPELQRGSATARAMVAAAFDVIGP